MAKSISEEELQLRKRARRRLIGAIALVTIVAVFLPMVLDHEPKPVNQDISIQIPSPNSGNFTSKIVPVVPGGADGKTVAKAEREVPASPTPASKGEPLKASADETVGKTTAPAIGSPPVFDTEAAPPKKAVSESSKAAAASVPKNTPPATDRPKVAVPAKDSSKDTGTFVVQVAALNDGAKAKQMQEQIASGGVKSYTEVVPTKGGNVTRVRAGPFGSRAEAEKVRDKLKAMGLTGNIVPK